LGSDFASCRPAGGGGDFFSPPEKVLNSHETAVEIPFIFCYNRKIKGGRAMMISTKGRYALRVLADMAEHQSDSYLPLKDIARRQDISEKYLESIVKMLVKGGVLRGLRGKGGGYRLNKSPDQYTIGEILRMTEGSLAPVACLESGAPLCGRISSCRTLTMWQGLDRVVNEYLDGYTIADLMRTEQPGDYYVI